MTTKNFTPDFRVFGSSCTEDCRPTQNCNISVWSESIDIEVDCTIDGGTERVTFDIETWQKIVEFVERSRESIAKNQKFTFHDSDIDS